MSITAIIAVLATLLVIAGVGLLRGGMLFSPGPLNAQASGDLLGGVRSHAEIARCAQCHTPPWGGQRMANACLDCHTDLVQDPKNFHNQMVSQGQSQGCQECHTDHRGPAASMTTVDLQNFPHDATGYSLLAHQKMADGAPFRCADCHTTYTHFDPGVCVTCHNTLKPAFMVTHLAAYGQDCRACHDGVDSYGHAFDHQKLAFTLTGKHAGLECTSCHTGARSIAAMKATSTQCYACHAKDDAHQGQFGQDCTGCHTPDGWLPAKFDHAQSAFPLVGKHLGVACASCHANQVFKGTPTACYDCHARGDAHQGQFGQDCALCHAADGWLPSTFDHTKTAFPLTGAHLQAACVKCHVKDALRLAEFKGTPTACASCHADPAYHQGLFGADCAACHTTSAWLPAKFNNPHAFPLNHGSASTCRSCHPSSLRGYACFSCHDQAQMVNKHQEEGINDITDCIKCHPGGRGGEGRGD